MTERYPVHPHNKDQASDAEPIPIRTEISRRELISSLALSCLGLVSADLMAETTLTRRQPGGPVREGQILSESQMRLLRDLVENIIPQTDTPGAAATDTHGFIDDQLANCQAPEEAEVFIAGLDQFTRAVQTQSGSGFSDLSPEDQIAALTALAHDQSPFDSMPPDFFRNLKALTILGYYSSEAGASQELVYLPVPGGFQANFTVADNGGKSFSPKVF